MDDPMPSGSSTTQNRSPDAWDEVAKSLRRLGVATVDLNDVDIEALHAHSFSVTRTALNVVKRSPESVSWIPVNAADPSAAHHATGYHNAGGENSLSRYNQYREGFVVSDNQFFGVTGQLSQNFEKSMRDLSSSLHDIAEKSMGAIERELELSCGWFQEHLGPTRKCSQFHVKRYVVPDDSEEEKYHEHSLSRSDVQDERPRTLLPVHTDPSLISVIVHDCKGKNPTAMGLEYFDTQAQGWIPVPFHGHGIAIVFVGSVLSYMTGNRYPAVKHRVVEDRRRPERMAATLFVRPHPSASLDIPPSPHLSEQAMQHKKKSVTFAVWIARVSRNYSKRKSG